MNIRYITCSDLREDVNINDALRLLGLSSEVELGIQAHPSDMSEDKPRNKWFNELLKRSKDAPKPLNIALHVNYQWCTEFCCGRIPPEIVRWMSERNNTNDLLIKRLQLNIGDGTTGFDANKLAKIIEDHPLNEFIFPYNNIGKVQEQITKLNQTGAKFSLLYDASYGAGKAPDSWDPPVFKNHPQGYSGGLCGENVHVNLDMISSVVPKNYTIWTDAEGKLMKPNTRQFDIVRARDYILKVLEWENSHARA